MSACFSRAALPYKMYFCRNNACLHTSIHSVFTAIHKTIQQLTDRMFTYLPCRWWPCQILDELDLPDNIFSKPHTPCQFPTICLGTKEFAWLDMSRVYSYEDGDKGSSSSNHSMSNSFKLGKFSLNAKILQIEVGTKHFEIPLQKGGLNAHHNIQICSQR